MMKFSYETLISSCEMCISAPQYIDEYVNELFDEINEYLEEISGKIQEENEFLLVYTHEKNNLDKELMSLRNQMKAIETEILSINANTDYTVFEKMHEIASLNMQKLNLKKDAEKIQSKINIYREVITLTNHYIQRLRSAEHQIKSDIEDIKKNHQYLNSKGNALAFRCNGIINIVNSFYSASLFSEESGEYICIDSDILKDEIKNLDALCDTTNTVLNKTFNEFSQINKNQDNVFISIYDDFAEEKEVLDENMNEFVIIKEHYTCMLKIVIEYENYV